MHTEPGQAPLYDPPSPESLGPVMSNAGSWYTVGLTLGLSTRTLNDIQVDYTSKDQKREMFRAWLTKKPEMNSWDRVAKELEEKNFSKPAKDILQRYGMIVTMLHTCF